MLETKAREKINALYVHYGSWKRVGIVLVGTAGNYQSMGAMANRAASGGSISSSLLNALGLVKHRYRRAIEFETAEDVVAFDAWLEDQGYSSATEWFKAQIWEIY